MMRVVIAVDPGREKCGVAVVSEQGVLERMIVPPDRLTELIPELADRYMPSALVIGDGTSGRALAGALQTCVPSVPTELVDESYTTLRGRARFFDENPPTGLRRLIPRGMLTPNRPFDDLVAVILAEQYLYNRK